MMNRKERQSGRVPNSNEIVSYSAQSASLSLYYNPLKMVSSLWRYRELIWQFTRREIEGRYKGSFLGILWSVGPPLILLLTYTFVFGIVFKSRWHNARSNNLAEFALVMFCGLMAYNFFSECVTRAPSIIVQVPNYVKKVVFPLEILPVSIIGGALFHCLVNLTILLLINGLSGGSLYISLLLFPLILLPLIFVSLGLTWFLSGLGVYVRDIQHTVGLVVQVLFFLTPIFYSLEVVPQPYNRIIAVNPLSAIVEAFRRVLLWGIMPDWSIFLILLVFSWTLMASGYAWFMKTKRGFADVI